MILAIVEQRSVHLRWRAVLKTLLMNAGQNGRLFTVFQPPRRRPQRARSRRTKPAPAALLKTRSGNAKILTGALHADQRAEVFGCSHQEFSLSGTGGTGSSVVTGTLYFPAAAVGYTARPYKPRDIAGAILRRVREESQPTARQAKVREPS